MYEIVDRSGVVTLAYVKSLDAADVLLKYYEAQGAYVRGPVSVVVITNFSITSGNTTKSLIDGVLREERKGD